MKFNFIKWSAIILLASTITLSCQKENTPVPTTSPNSSTLGVGLIANQSDISIGTLHNLFVDKYITTFGITEFSTLDSTAYYTIQDRMGDLAEGMNIFNSNTPRSAYDAIVINITEELDFLESSATIPTVAQFAPEIITLVDNSTARTALTNVLNLVNTGQTNIRDTAVSLLAGLQDLNAQDQLMIDNFVSVWRSSYDLWDDYLPASKVGTTAAADAYGAMIGTRYAVATGHSAMQAKAYASVASAYFSAMEAERHN